MVGRIEDLLFPQHSSTNSDIFLEHEFFWNIGIFKLKRTPFILWARESSFCLIFWRCILISHEYFAKSYIYRSAAALVGLQVQWLLSDMSTILVSVIHCSWVNYIATSEQLGCFPRMLSISFVLSRCPATFIIMSIRLVKFIWVSKRTPVKKNPFQHPKYVSL